MDEPRILFLTTGGNKIHLRLIQSLHNVTTKNLYTMNKWSNPLSNLMGLIKAIGDIPTSYDLIICESNYYFPALKKMLFMLPKTKIIDMNTSPLLYSVLKKRLPFFYRIPLRFLLRFVDGYISIGKYGIDVVKELGENKPNVIAYPSIPEDLPESLLSLNPDLGSHEIAIIVRKDPISKGLPLAIEAMKQISESYPDAHLHVIGDFKMDGALKRGMDEAGNIVLHGWVDDISSIFEKCSIYLHPGQGEPFGMGVLEAMAAGLIPVVSAETGMKEFVVEVDERNIVALAKEDISARIITLFQLDKSELDSLSGKARKIASSFKGRTGFIDDFKQLVKTIV